MYFKQPNEKLFLSTLIASVAIASPYQVDASSHVDNKEKIDFKISKQHYRYGHVGPSIKLLQTELMNEGFYQEKIDGKYGPHTQAAVIQYQLKHSLKVDGIAGPNTLELLFKNKIVELTTESTNTDIVLKVGNEGPKVSDIQKKLKSLKYYSDKVDGIFGKGTYSAVSRFQKRNNLSVDGIVGPKTYEVLLSDQAIANNPNKIKVNETHSVKTNIISYAKNMIGVSYKWGGTTPDGFDCSGFIKYVFNQKGYNIPRTVNELWNFGISISKPSIGDIVFFETYKPGPSHAGIYLGNGEFIHAGSSKGVTVSKINMSYWQKRYLGSKRIIQF